MLNTFVLVGEKTPFFTASHKNIISNNSTITLVIANKDDAFCFHRVVIVCGLAYLERDGNKKSFEKKKLQKKKSFDF